MQEVIQDGLNTEQIQDEEGTLGWEPVLRRMPRKLLSARQLSLRLWLGVITAIDLLDHPDSAVKLKAIHALSAAAGQYLKGLEIGDVQKRLDDLEAARRDERVSGEAG